MKDVTLEMTQKQINRYCVIRKSLEGKITVAETASQLGISERQVTRLRKGVTEEGAAYLIHKSKGRASPKAITGDEKRKIQELYRNELYNGANFRHFSELLREKEGIDRSYSTIRKALTEGGIKSPKTRRKSKKHRSRKRKAQAGMLIQMDATPYKWFGGNAMYALHGAIDDATSNIVGAYMTKNECLHGYFETMRQVIEENGVPISAYADRHTVFLSPKADKLTVEEQLEGKTAADTQFGRAMKELGINLIAARSPQAKGRIERLWETLQSRLVIEFRINNVKSVDDANLFLSSYIPQFNARFAVEAENTESAYAPLASDLDTILCVKETRIADNGGVFSFHRRLFKITSEDMPTKAKIEVIVSETRGILAFYKGRTLEVSPFTKPPKVSAPITEKKSKTAPGSSWRNPPPRYSADLRYSEIRDMLDDIFLSKYGGV